MDEPTALGVKEDLYMNGLRKCEYKDYWTHEASTNYESNRLIEDARGVRERNLSIFEPEYELLIDWWEDFQLE